MSGTGGRQNISEYKYAILLLVKFNHPLKIKLYPTNVADDFLKRNSSDKYKENNNGPCTAECFEAFEKVINFLTEEYLLSWFHCHLYLHMEYDLLAVHSTHGYILNCFSVVA